MKLRKHEAGAGLRDCMLVIHPGLWLGRLDERLAVHKDSTRSAGEALLNMSRLGALIMKSAANIDLQLTNIEGVDGRNVIRSWNGVSSSRPWSRKSSD